MMSDINKPAAIINQGGRFIRKKSNNQSLKNSPSRSFVIFGKTKSSAAKCSEEESQMHSSEYTS